MAKTLRDWLLPVLFLVEGAFWVAVVALGGGALLLLAALAGILSGVLLIARPSHWVTRPLAGATALFALTITVYQVYEASTLIGSSLTSAGATSAVVFGVFTVISVFLELETISLGSKASAQA